ncbi:hypothetical protein B0H13DRAFT_2291201 [Mycena leptocephala]|nr:hypothetical protein B0H13DRAFT_2291201 [Mycena leptocephala]
MPRTEFTALLFFALISLSSARPLPIGKSSIQRSPSVCGGPSQWDCSGRRLDGDGDVARVAAHDLGPDNIQVKPRIIDGNGGLAPKISRGSSRSARQRLTAVNKVAVAATLIYS